ncbi:unnamed protein product [Trifolium pratense]|uniref:Uncharacterized protein n=1 Tax=Trifolium pratense TaxID=57577 RepID=A0ACB0IVQ4_TRIPR|nr:unnamed protein product [Trifolium pratense]
MYYYLVSILLVFLTVITLTKSQNINPNYHQIHDESAPPNRLISYHPPTTDLQKLVALKHVRIPNAPRVPTIATPGTPHLAPKRGGHRSRPPPKM